MNDTRLLGHWRSDAAKTRRELAARRDIPTAVKRRLGQLFGKVELTFTKSQCHSKLNGSVDSLPYVVVAKDATSVATVSAGTISHFHFEGGRLWILVGAGKFREYFRRVRPPNRQGLTNLKRQ